MDIQAARYIGAGFAVIALAGVGAGIGNVFAALVSSVSRNPSSRAQIFPLAIIGFALVESTALYALMMAFLILYA